MHIMTRIAGLATGTALSIGLAFGVTSGPAEAITSDMPVCGFDVYRGKVYVTSLSVKGTARVIKWNRQGIGTLVDYGPIKPGQTITVNAKGIKPSRITVSVVKGKLTRNESHRKVWECEPA